MKYSVILYVLLFMLSIGYLRNKTKAKPFTIPYNHVVREARLDEIVKISNSTRVSIKAVEIMEDNFISDEELKDIRKLARSMIKNE